MEATIWGLGSSVVEQSIWLVGLGFRGLGWVWEHAGTRTLEAAVALAAAAAGGSPKFESRGTVLGVPTIRTVVFRVLVHLFFGKHHVVTHGSAASSSPPFFHKPSTHTHVHV